MPPLTPPLSRGAAPRSLRPQGEDPRDPTTLGGGAPADGAAGGRPLRVGVPAEYAVEELSTASGRAWAEAAAALRAGGCEVAAVSLPSTRAALAAYYILAPSEAARCGARRIRPLSLALRVVRCRASGCLSAHAHSKESVASWILLSRAATWRGTGAWRRGASPGRPAATARLRSGARWLRTRRVLPCPFCARRLRAKGAIPAGPSPRARLLRRVEVTRRVLLGTFATSSEAAAQYYERAQRVRRVVASEFSRAFGSVDVLLTPSGALSLPRVSVAVAAEGFQCKHANSRARR